LTPSKVTYFHVWTRLAGFSGGPRRLDRTYTTLSRAERRADALTGNGLIGVVVDYAGKTVYTGKSN
jgi:hypothetical protein